MFAAMSLMSHPKAASTPAVASSAPSPYPAPYPLESSGNE